MNRNRLQNAHAVRTLWASGAMTTGNETRNRFLAAKACVELAGISLKPCGGPHEGTTEHHLPLTRKEVRLLMQLAYRASELDPGEERLRTIALIGIRFTRAVPGAKCPPDVDGFTADVQMVMQRLFKDFLKIKPESAIIDMFMSILDNKQMHAGEVSPALAEELEDVVPMLAQTPVIFVKVKWPNKGWHAMAIRSASGHSFLFTSSNPLYSIGETGIIEKSAV